MKKLISILIAASMLFSLIVPVMAASSGEYGLFADFEDGNLVKRITSLVPVLVPLFISAVRRANDLAMAMEARCYHGSIGRTKMKPLIYTKRDYMAYLVIAIYVLVWVLIKVML